ncbi:MAG: ABC transporter substrate-binding protein [Alphaproteobacteria bacterium]|nr:ABC transporter substrate-binding protein [Alphaproteobacteria bacterium]
MKRERLWGSVFAAAALALVTAPPAEAQNNVLRVVPQADVKVLDSHFSSIQITKIFALMVQDTLFAWDYKLGAKPQMVESWSTSPDKLTWTFKLRPGLKFHDGQPVTSKDAIASITRWTKRDVIGQRLAQFTAEWNEIDNNTFSLKLKEPYGFVEFSLGSAGGQMPVIFRESDAKTDAATQISSGIGSGPFILNRDEWKPGAFVAFKKNPDYIPRSEPVDGLTGGKVARVDRVEWHIIPDAGTVAAALTKGEVDLWDSPSTDQLGPIVNNRDIVIEKLPPFGNYGGLRVNSLHPPFNNVKARQALAYLFDQRDFMAAAYGDQRWWKVCHAYYVCDGPWATEAGSEMYKKKDMAKAKQLFAEAGYKGEKLILITTNELPQIGAMAQVAAANLKEIGVNVELQVSDWGTVVSRMPKKDPPDQGGWNMFTTWFTGTTMHSPLTNIGTNMRCGGANWFGWACDDEAEKLRDAFLKAPDDAARKAALEPLHKRLMETQPIALLGQFDPPFVWRKNVNGVVKGAVLVFWNISKS